MPPGASFFQGGHVRRAQFRKLDHLGDVDAQGQLALLPQLVIDIEGLEISFQAVGASHSVAPRFFQAVANGRHLFFARGSWHLLADDVGGILLERSGEFASLGVAHEFSVQRIGSGAGDAGQL